MLKGYFISGTDTGVGKTLVASILVNRFDDLISSEGEQRFMKDQDQMISRDIIRVIWR